MMGELGDWQSEPDDTVRPEHIDPGSFSAISLYAVGGEHSYTYLFIPDAIGFGRVAARLIYDVERKAIPPVMFIGFRGMLLQLAEQYNQLGQVEMLL